MDSERRYILTLSCPDRVGVVAAVSNFLAEYQGWILEAAHHADQETGRFFMRQEIRADSLPFGVEQLRERFAEIAGPFGMTWQIHDTATPRKVVLLCSKQDHCIVDLLHRWRTGEMHGKLVGVISNHETMRSYVDWHQIPYHHIPVPPGSREEKQPAFDQTLKLCQDMQADLLVLARYMQILPDTFCAAYPNRIINIHHSFLPSFIGGKPYHQAYERGVKLVGATCHYVTADLDAGPIIEQDITRVNHGDMAEDMVHRGKDVERAVLAKGVRLHLQDRVIVQGNKTVVFE